MYLYNEVGRGDVAREGAEVDSPLLMGRQLGIVLVVQGDAGQCSSDGGRVAGVHLLEYDWKMPGDKEKGWGGGGRAGGGGAHAGVSADGTSKVRGKGTFGRKEKNREGFEELVSNRGQLADRLVQQEQKDLN